ncbi:hypothetical protein Ait01nite_030520 [Actinoplanes italicus]|uniref:Uncharacterized protein n=1 Tax=Actinoplanes italicus TaxID=113567 RepID=A0A2T0KJ03_9ACTN|nr:hypothetical protein [Actinoplanes italicus]PRX23511.1 hypothetical protein CLV67_103259 [Actinoplanes italicus]GIE30007.1 hypothetical protein Ait01nite_030520 [Actinoplanes italicus]
MTYEPPTNPSLWQVLLADEEGYVTTTAKALDEYGQESNVEVSIRRLSALPTQMSNGWWLTNRPEDEADIAVEWKLDMVDDIGETDHIDAQLKAAQAMAAGLNGALANQGDWNRGTELSAAFHDLGDRLAAFTGELPRSVWLTFHFVVPAGTKTFAVERLATALIDTAPVAKKISNSWEYEAQKKLTCGLDICVQTPIPAPDEENPAVLKARIAELEAKLAGGNR